MNNYKETLTRFHDNCETLIVRVKNGRMTCKII